MVSVDQAANIYCTKGTVATRINYQNLPRTLALDTPGVLTMFPPRSKLIPPIATLTGRIGAESKTWGQG